MPIRANGDSSDQRRIDLDEAGDLFDRGVAIVGDADHERADVELDVGEAMAGCGAATIATFSSTAVGGHRGDRVRARRRQRPACR